MLIFSLPCLPKAFEANYHREFGFTLVGRAIHVDDMRVRCTGKGKAAPRPKVQKAQSAEHPAAIDCEMVYFEGVGRVSTPLYNAAELYAGHHIPGPAIIMQDVSTIVVEPVSGNGMNVQCTLQMRILVKRFAGHLDETE